MPSSLGRLLCSCEHQDSRNGRKDPSQHIVQALEFRAKASQAELPMLGQQRTPPPNRSEMLWTDPSPLIRKPSIQYYQPGPRQETMLVSHLGNMDWAEMCWPVL